MPKLIRITTVPLSLKLLLRDQMKFMDEAGWDVLMVSSDGKEINELVKREGCEHEIIPFTRKITPLKDLYCIWLLVRLFKKHQPDIVHTHTPKSGLLGMIAARICGIKVRIHTVAGLPYVGSRSNKRRLLVAMEKLTYRMASQVWPNSLHLKELLLSEKLANASKIKVLGNGSTNGVDLEKFNRQNLQENHLIAAVMRVAPGENDFIILAAGRLVKDKGIEELVRAFLASKIIQKSKLVLLGSFEQDLNPLAEDIVRKIEDHPRIVHVEWSDHVAHYMAISDVCIHPSHREGLPNVLMEAGAMQLPVICSDIPGNLEVIQHKKSGLVFPVKNEAALKEAMEFAYVKREVMQEYADSLFGEVNQKYCRENVHEQLLENYQQLISEST